MDIVHHTLIGGAGFLGALAGDMPGAGAAFLAASVFPDLDVFFMVFGRHVYLRNHQGITHSVLLAPVYALLIAGLFGLLPGVDASWSVFLGALAGLLAHISLDWLNTFRIALFAPFGKQRYSADAVFFIDAVSLALVAVFYLLYVEFDVGAALWLYPTLFIAYLAFKYWLRVRVGRLLKPLFAIPGSLNPFVFYILDAHGDSQVAYLYNALTGRRSEHRCFGPVSPEHQKQAEQSAVFRDMQTISRAFRITEVLEDDSGVTIRASDVAIRNFGGRFGATELRFDQKGALVHEVANV